MDGDSLVEAVRDAKATQLQRLGKEKALIATTGASLERTDVLRAAASAEARARDTFETWAADGGPAGEAFAEAAEREADHLERVLALSTESAVEPDPDPDPLHAYLADLDGPIERAAGGLVGRPMAAERTLLQVVNFFVNEAENAVADEFRTMRAETAASVEKGAAVLEELCADESDWVLAQQAAEGAITSVYDDYADTLTGLGIDPKPVC
jgi:hypothetical protein